MLDGFTLGNYLMLVEHTGRMLRDGKASITAEVSDILARVGSSAEAWQCIDAATSRRPVARKIHCRQSRGAEVDRSAAGSHAAGEPLCCVGLESIVG